MMDEVIPESLPLEATRGSYGNLEVYIDPPRRLIKLEELKSLTSHLQRTLDAVARNLNNLSETESSGLDYFISDAKIGSFGFTIQAASVRSGISPDVVMATFTEDLESIRSRHYRPTLSPDLLRNYKGLVRALSESHTKISYTYNQTEILVDDVFRGIFEFAARDRRAGVLSIVGKIEGLNTHRLPHVFSLYPKLTSSRIECRFPHAQLGIVADIIKQKRIVQVTGETYYAPVGIYPTLIEVTEPPRVLDYNPARLRERIRSLSLVPEGINLADFLQQNRKAAGLED